MKNNRFLLFPSSIAASFILLSAMLHAAAITWDAEGGDTNWSTFNNWSDNAEPTGDDVTFNATGALASGTTNTLSSSISIASLSYTQESDTFQHTTAIAAGQTLTVAGNFLLAGSTAATTATNVTLTGSTGTLTVNGTSFQVGQPSPASGTTATNLLDMSGLGTFNANLGSTGVFRIGPNSGGTVGPVVTAKLAATSSITTDVFGVGDRSGRGGTHTLILGSVANTINANTISVGTNSGRGNGELLFETGTGTLKIRATDGTSAATMNLINNGFGTGNNVTGIANFAGHSVDAKIGTLTMGRRVGTSTGTVSATSTFTFDTGILEVGTLNLAQNGAGSSTLGAIVATMNIGGGTASFNTITMATSTGGASTTTTAALNLTGGTTTVNGNISRGGGNGTSATVKLDGGTLDMDNGNIGDGTNAVTLILASGTLRNVAQVNDGADLSKTSAGNLVLSGNNTFTGGMNMFGGEVKITGSGSFGIGTKSLNIQNGAYVNLDGTAGDIALSSGISMTTAGLSFLNTAGDNTINGNISVIAGNSTTTATSDGGSLNLAGSIASGTGSLRILELSGSSVGANQVSGTITNGTGAGSINVKKSGTGTWALTNSSNDYNGTTTVSDGTLLINGNNSLATGAVTVESGGTLGGSGTVGGATTIQLNGSLAAGDGLGTQSFSSSLTMDLGSVVEWDLAGNTTTGRGTNYDGINVTGLLSIDSDAMFRVIRNSGLNFNDSFWATNQTWTDIFSAGTLDSNWSNSAVSVYDTSDALQDVSSYGAFSITGETLSWTAIPEPKSALLGLLGTVLLLRRRKA